MRFDLRPARTQPIVKPVRANAWVGANGNEVTVDVPSKETDQLIARVVEREGPCPKTQSASIVIAMTAVAVAFSVVIVVSGSLIVSPPKLAARVPNSSMTSVPPLYM